MHLVDDHEPDTDRAERLDEALLAQPLRRRVQEPCATRRHSREPSRDLLGGERRVDERCGRRHAGGSLSTWSFISAISGESTRVGSGRSIAAS